MTDKLYRVRPLEWTVCIDPEIDNAITMMVANSAFGVIVVYATSWGLNMEFPKSRCFSIEDGVAAAEAWYCGRLLQALTEVTDAKGASE